MPFEYKRKTSRGTPSLDSIKKAVKEIVEDNKGLRATADKWNIPKSTLSRYVKNREKLDMPTAEGEFQSKYATTQIFSSNEEKLLVEYVLTCSKMHYGLSKLKTREIAYQFAYANGKKIPDNWKEQKLASIDWLRGFLKRNPGLSVRKPEALTLSRATSFNRKNVSDFFENLDTVLKNFKFGPESIYNVDETAVKTVQDTTRVIAQKGTKQIGQMTSSERGQLVTMCLAVNAIGNAIPPFFIFPRQKFRENLMLRGATPGSSGAANKSGWQSQDTFLIFFEHFLKHTKPTPEKPVLLIMDNHESHVNVNVIDQAKKNHVVLLTLPPHCSNRLQPLDVSVFAPFKGYYNRAIDSWLVSNPGKTISIYEIAELSGQAFLLALTPKNIQQGFKKSGIYPLNPDIFTDDDFLGSSVTDRPNPHPESTTAAKDTMPVSCNTNCTSSTSTHACRPTATGVPAVSTNLDLMEASTSADNRPTCGLRLCQTPATKSLNKIITPEEVRPYPKAGERKNTNKGKKPSKTRILTDTPVKKQIEEEKLKKDEKEALKNSIKKRKCKSKGPCSKKLFRNSNRDDDDDDDLTISSGESVLNMSSSDEEELMEFQKDDLKQGTFIMVEFIGGLRQSTKFKYACVIQRPPDPEPVEDAELSVMALKAVDQSKKVFIAKEEDVSFIHVDNVLGILPNPDVTTQGDRVRFVFKKKINVFEK